MEGMRGQIETHHSLETYFRELLQEALEAEQVDLDDAGVAYLLHLVAEFSRSEGLHGRARPDEPGTPTLTWLLAKAQEGDAGKRFDAYRHLGDVSLVVSGFFTPHIERRRSLVGVDYYVQMGTAAYDTAAALARRSGFQPLFAELASKFRHLVEVLTRVAERTTLPVAADAGTLYARLMRNPESRALKQRLIGQGLVPVFGLGARA